MEKKLDLVSTYQLSRINEQHGGKWFCESNIKFHRSRISQYAFVGVGGTFFVSSERSYDGERRYSVREACDGGKVIRTYGEYQAYATRARAEYAARKAAMGRGLQEANVSKVSE